MNKSFHKLYILFLTIIFSLSCFLRLEHYLNIRSFWHDEASLAYNIVSRNYLALLQPLDFTQSAPPIFLWIVKTCSYFNAVPIEASLRFIPFLVSIISIFIFFKISQKIFSNKIAIILSNLLFCINYQLIYYSQELKQYSTDVLLTLILIYYLYDINLKTITKKQFITLSLTLAICPLISLPSLFIIAGFITYWIINKSFKSINNLLSFITPITIILLIYYITILYPSQKLMFSIWEKYWNGGFLSINNLILIKTNLQFLFSQNNFWFIILIPITFGIFLGIKNKLKITYQILLIFFFISTASILHIYPSKNRIILYTIPLIIILSLIPLNFISKTKKVYSTIILGLTIFAFSQYNFDYIKPLATNKALFERERSREFMQIMIDNYKPTDIVIHNNASSPEYIFYSYIYNFTPLRFGEIRNTLIDEKYYLKNLDLFPKNNYYWFYYPYDYKIKKTVQLIKKWNSLHGQTIIEKEEYGSYLLYTYVKQD